MPISAEARKKGVEANKRNAALRKKALSKGEQWEVLGEFITNAGAKKYLKYLNSIKDPKVFAREYKEMLNYFKPKQQSQSIKQDTAININLLPKDKNVLKKLGQGNIIELQPLDNKE